ncbi:MAG: hypothetical protein ACD_13C00193G0001 [uncultured bacterium]|nr:MAG: hypothetical protein ACD_13C00193G0001 [uncultured bacterium]
MEYIKASITKGLLIKLLVAPMRFKISTSSRLPTTRIPVITKRTTNEEIAKRAAKITPPILT